MDAHQVALLLSKTTLFSALNERGCLELAERTTQRAYRPGQVVFVQDEPGDRMFVVAEGSVKLLIRSSHGDAVELARLWPTDVFGEVALLDGGPRSASAEAVERSILVAIGRSELIRLLRSNGAVVDALLNSLGGLVRRANRQSTDLIFLDLRGRVAKKLLELGKAGGAVSGTLLRITQGDLAQMVGGARQTVNQVLKQFEDHGWIRMANRTIEIVGWEGLRRQAGG
ncbi:MAG TPA: Crp/Fnr family transcriptional regulator [Actinomycetes bacterium]